MGKTMTALVGFCAVMGLWAGSVQAGEIRTGFLYERKELKR